MMVLGPTKFHMDGEQPTMKKLQRKRIQLTELPLLLWSQMLEELQSLSLFSIAKRMLHLKDSLIRKLPKLNVSVSSKRDKRTEKPKEKRIEKSSVEKLRKLSMRMRNQPQKKSLPILKTK